MTRLIDGASWSRRRCLAALSLLAVPSARAQGDAVRIIVGFPPGGGADYVARLLAEHLKDQLGVPVIVDTRPGAGGVVAASVFLQASADGRTLILASDHMLSVIPMTIAKPGYDPARDFLAVGTVALGETAFAVHPHKGVKTLGDYAAWLRTHPKDDVAGIPAPGSAPEFIVALLAKPLGNALRPVPYRGGAPLIQDLVAGQIPAGLATVGELFTHHQAGRVRMLGLTGAKRMPLLPEVPTFGELGLAGLDHSTYLALFTRSGTPAPMVARLNQALRATLEAPKMREGLTTLSMAPLHESPEELAARRDRSASAWARIIKSSGYVPQ
jgi:tripartite-type tricarboxylate transporter receptor subunit TctC